MPLITQKSKFVTLLLLAYSNGNCRILLACVKFLGTCLCPRCLVTKDKICKLGTKLDLWVRDKKACVNDRAHQLSIENVHKAIFDFGCSIASKAVEGVIGAKSLVPTRVHNNITGCALRLILFLEHIFR